MDPTWKQEIVGSKAGLLDPLLNGVARRRRDLELHRTLCLLLHDDGPRGDLVAMTDVPKLQLHQVTAPELAVDAQIEQRQFPHPIRHLKADPKRPDVLQLDTWRTTSDRSFAFGASNATVFGADVLMLLAIGDTGVPVGLSPGPDFTIARLDL
jgi:hypothetical protein